MEGINALQARKQSVENIVAVILLSAMTCLLGPAPAHAAPEIQYSRQFGSSVDDSAEALVVSAGGTFVVGETDGTLLDQTSSGGKDAFVRKHSASGDAVWTRQFGTSSLDRAYGVAATGGDIYVVGDTDGTLPDQTSAGGKDAFVRKYDAAGDLVWTRQFGTAGADQAYGVAATSGGIYVVGTTTGTLPDQTSGGTTDAYVRKYDTAGNIVWTRQFGGSASDQAHAVAVTSGAVYVAGYTFGTLPGQSSSGGTDAFVRKYDTAGDLAWTDQFGTSASDLALDVAATSGGIYVAGYTDGTLPEQSNLGGSDAFLRKYNASGDDLWTSQFGTSTTDQGRGVAVGSGGIYVGGYTFGTFPDQSSAGDFDTFVRKYDASGKPMWTHQFGTSGDDQAYGITATTSGIYLAGETEGTFPDQSSSGGDDAFLAHLVSYQPDGLISLARNRLYAGNDIYNTTGANQTKEATVKAGNARTFFIRGQNDGDARDAFKVKGCEPSTGFKVTYLAGLTGTNDITQEVLAGTYKLRRVIPGARKTFRVVIRAANGADVGMKKSCQVAITSMARPTSKDIVKGTVRVVQG